MRKTYLDPDQIITLSDFPVHNEHVLKMYYKMCHEGAHKLVPPCPVVKREVALQPIPSSSAKARRYNQLLAAFVASHPNAKYVLLDGSHRTTAATLARKKTAVLVFETDKDIIEARKLVEKGVLLGLTAGTKNNRMEEVANTLQEHFLKAMQFQTVEEKTKRMVREKVVPGYMIRGYASR